ncbi:MAG: hypothetical protein ACYSWP_16085 [Planctomycetota bacterium]
MERWASSTGCWMLDPRSSTPRPTSDDTIGISTDLVHRVSSIEYRASSIEHRNDRLGKEKRCR